MRVSAELLMSRPVANHHDGCRARQVIVGMK